MKYAIAVAAFILGMMFTPNQSVRAGLSGTVKVTEVTPGAIIAVYGSNVVGFSCAPGKENMHCYIATTQ